MKRSIKFKLKLVLILAIFFGINFPFVNGFEFKIAQEEGIEDLSITIVWNKTYGGLKEDIPREVIQTNDGGFLILGHTRSFGVKTWTLWIVKTDSTGVEEWNRTFADIRIWFDDYSIVETNDGYMLLGQFWTDLNDGEAFWVIKIDTQGVQKWNKTFSGYKQNYSNETHDISISTSLSSVIPTKDSGFFSYGKIQTTFLLINATSGSLDRDFWIAKWDSSGNEQWNKSFGEPGSYDFITGAIEVSDGGYAILAYTSTFDAETQSFNENIMLLKTDSKGNLLWKNKFRDGYSSSLTETSDGGFLLTGVKTSSLESGYEFELWQIKTNNLGIIQWDNSFTTSDRSYSGLPIGIERPYGGYLIANSGKKNILDNQTDIFVISTDSNGNEISNITIGGYQNDTFYSLIKTKENDYVILGITNSYGFGLNQKSGVDIWLIKITEDRDKDGMVDSWELIYGLNISQNDAQGDLDQDGMPNYYEFVMGFDPLVHDSHLDPDGDFVSNLDEYLGGTDPFNIFSFPIISFNVVYLIVLLVILVPSLIIWAIQRIKNYKKKIKAPTYFYALLVLKSDFKNFKDFNKAKLKGASSNKEYNMVLVYKAPNYKIASEIQKGNFKNYEHYLQAKVVGAFCNEHYLLVLKYNAPDYDTAFSIESGGFPSLKIYEQAINDGYLNFEEYKNKNSKRI